MVQGTWRDLFAATAAALVTLPAANAFAPPKANCWRPGSGKGGGC